MEEVAVPHVVMYYDAEMKGYDGLCWCVELLPSSSTYRFPTLYDAQMFIAFNSSYFTNLDYHSNVKESQIVPMTVRRYLRITECD